MSQTEQKRVREQEDASGHGPGGEQVQHFGAVFYIMVAISALFVLAGALFTEPFGAALATVVGYITDYLGWFYMLMTSFFLAFAILMCLMCWCLCKTLRRDYREERRQVQEVMAHDQNVEKLQMQEIMRRHEAGEPVSPISQNPKK